jgi:Domain of unknown function DUF.
MAANEWLTLLILALALGMDAFSVSFGLGMGKIRYRQIFRIGLSVGFFHLCLPFFGIIFGKFLSLTLGTIAVNAGGAILVFIGLQMFLSSFRENSPPRFRPAGIGLFLFSISVSVDSFSVGLSLGIFGIQMITAAFLFGIMATLLTWAGLVFGRKLTGWLGNYGEAFGGAILLFFGLKLLFPFL